MIETNLAPSYVLVSAFAVPYSTSTFQFQAKIYDVVMVAPQSLSTLRLTVDNNNHVPTA